MFTFYINMVFILFKCYCIAIETLKLKNQKSDVRKRTSTYINYSQYLAASQILKSCLKCLDHILLSRFKIVLSYRGVLIRCRPWHDLRYTGQTSSSNE